MKKNRAWKQFGRKYLSMLLAVGMVVSLTACGPEEPEEIDPGYTNDMSWKQEEPDPDYALPDEEIDPGFTFDPEQEKEEEIMPQAGGSENKEEGGIVHTSHAIRTVAYPEMAQYPEYDDFGNDWNKYEEAMGAWRESRSSLRPENEYYKAGLKEFCTATIKEFIGAEDGKNKVYSPINVYMALAMLAEITDGESRAQILNLMQVDTIEILRNKVTDIWKSSYSDDGSATTLLGNSIWLRQGFSYVEETMKTLQEVYYASSYQGQMGSQEYNKMLQDWLNEQTSGLLAEQAEGVEMNPETVLAIASTLYFKASWRDEFSKYATEEKTFHGTAGDMTCEFMKQTDNQAVYGGDNFTAIAKFFHNSGSMFLILPDEGVAAEELLTDADVMELVFNRYDWENQKHLMVHLELPKFDVVSDLSLIDGLKNLGVTDVFDYTVSDFSPMTTAVDDLFVSQALHAARVKIDEEGCEAAAYTVITVDNESMFMGDEITLVFDRPFVFVITGDNGLPLFTGVVNQPK